MCIWNLLQVICCGVLALLVSAEASAYRRLNQFLSSGHGAKELWPLFHNRCDLACDFGFETDIEGNYVCRCYDPCKNVRCYGRRKCVVDLPKGCRRGEYCRPQAYCREMGPTPVQPSPTLTSTSTDLDVLVTSRDPASDDAEAGDDVMSVDEAMTTQADDARPWGRRGWGREPEPRCLQAPAGRDGDKCRRTRQRWFYDEESRSCKSFVGCKVLGANNFRGERGCQKTCGVRRSRAQFIARKNLKQLSQRMPPKPEVSERKASLARERVNRLLNASTKSRDVCTLLPFPIKTGCRRARTRWYYDAPSGSCRRMRSCPTPGNNFTKKKHCRRLCGQAQRERRKGRQGVRRSAGQ